MVKGRDFATFDVIPYRFISNISSETFCIFFNSCNFDNQCCEDSPKSMNLLTGSPAPHCNEFPFADNVKHVRWSQSRQTYDLNQPKCCNFWHVFDYFLGMHILCALVLQSYLIFQTDIIVPVTCLPFRCSIYSATTFKLQMRNTYNGRSHS